MTSAERATIRGRLPRSGAAVRSAVLVLHGGREHSAAPTSAYQLAVARMLDMYVALWWHSSRAAVYLLRYRVRGWNATADREPDPVVDARWALDEITRRYGAVPVTLLGHSMGGRTAFAVASDPRVVGVCALAPWLPDGEPLVSLRPSSRFVLAHGTADRTTSPAESLRYAERLRAAGGTVARFELAGGRHDLLTGARLWRRFAVAASLGVAGDADLRPGLAAAFADATPQSLRRPLSSALI